MEVERAYTYEEIIGLLKVGERVIDLEDNKVGIVDFYGNIRIVFCLSWGYDDYGNLITFDPPLYNVCEMYE